MKNPEAEFPEPRISARAKYSVPSILAPHPGHLRLAP